MTDSTPRSDPGAAAPHDAAPDAAPHDAAPDAAAPDVAPDAVLDDAPTSPGAAPTAPGGSIYAENMKLLRARDPAMADRIDATEPASLTWTEARSGMPTAVIDPPPDAPGARPMPLASKYDPAAEADKLLEQVDPGRHAGVVLLGLGVGATVQRLMPRLKQGVIIVYEPERPLLRAVLERLDCRVWLSAPHVILADDATDRGELLRRLEFFGGTLSLGTVLVAHPVTRRRCPEQVRAFGELFTEIIAYMRTTTATALVNAARTYRNMSMNLVHLAAGADITPLRGAARGRTAICVAAGPSLAKNIDLLRDPERREGVVLIAAQTALKLLLQRDVRPDFVTALDYAEISKRFYEDLPPLPDVTLIAEPLANPAILDAFPGPARVVPRGFTHRLLGDAAAPASTMGSGATVAHLSFYFAHYLGCDPIVLLGQDLAFSGGLYYCPGTAIHDVWAPELNAFNTLEMMEWTRVVRHRAQLQKRVDCHGREVYSDDQMLAYHSQFERDVSRVTDAEVLNATEGGLPIAGARNVTLAEVLDDVHRRLADRRARGEAGPPPLPPPPRSLDPDRMRAGHARFSARRRELARLRTATERTVPILRRMLDSLDDPKRLHKLFQELQAQRDVVDRHREIFDLLDEMNTIGAFKRRRADRALTHEALEGADLQRRQIERDQENLDWILQACDEIQAIFNEAETRFKQKLAAAGDRAGRGQSGETTEEAAACRV